MKPSNAVSTKDLSSEVQLTPREENNLRWELEDLQLKFNTLLEREGKGTGEWDV